MTLTYRSFTGGAVAEALADLARLRTEVFRDWPYLYDGDPANESDYLRSYTATPDLILVAAMQNGRMVGCATGMPLAHHQDVQDLPLADLGLRQEDVFYCAESVLLADHRGQGAGHAFFAAREDHARAAGFGTALFCAVERPMDHPKRPLDARDLAPFWEGRGYRARDAVITMTWRDIGDVAPSTKALRVWSKPL